MSEDRVTLTIDGNRVTVSKGTLLVDAAKQVGVDIPVFCYHPKLHSVGMCRMCLVEIGRPQRDRNSGEPMLDENGEVIISFGPNLETACTLHVEDGWVVNVGSERAVQGRREVVEFLLTSHPLDCPICDKGGECPLQNLTMEHGPGKSRFLVDDKMHLQKQVPLGELIFLDRERCIQCARCVRFQDEIVDDPVLGFSERGRRLEIVTFSTPGFDSYFSGNTTDICPVGALTTADFRFGARPWELNAAASICPHCPVGCNIVLNTRREAKAGGKEVVKRVMPRQNEGVNEIWICDKGRFAYHYALSEDRLSTPLVRVDGELKPATWGDALEKAAAGLKQANEGVVGLTSGRVSNEDLFQFHRFLEGVGGEGFLYDVMAGGDLVQKVGVGKGTNIGELGKGDVIMVVASDLLEEAPIWWLRVKQGVERGVDLIVLNARETKLDLYATLSLRYDLGSAATYVLGMLAAISEEVDLGAPHAGEDQSQAINLIQEARSLIIFYGAEGLVYKDSISLSQSCASILAATGHAGKPNNGLIPVWGQNNAQGAWDMGFEPAGDDLLVRIESAKALYIIAADPFGDMSVEIPEDTFVIVQELLNTRTVEGADVVFPAQSFLERDGTYTSGERIVQRFYPAVESLGEARPDWEILARLADRLGVELTGFSAAEIMDQISKDVDDYAEISYRSLLNSEPQWPHVGDDDLYFGGTAYKNEQGLGIHLDSAAGRGEEFPLTWTEPAQREDMEGFVIVPITRLLDRGVTVLHSEVLLPRLETESLWMNPQDLIHLGVEDGDEVDLRLNGSLVRLTAAKKDLVPPGSAFVPRSPSVPLLAPTPGEIMPASE